MKKTLILAALLLLVGGFAWWRYSQRTEDTFSKNIHTQFAVENPAEVARIFIADRNNHAVLLERQADESWLITNKTTNKTHPASPTAVHNLLETISKVRTRTAVPNAAVENVVKQLSAKAKKVELYDASGNILRTYYVGSSTDGGQGTYMMMQGAERPYVVYLPGFTGSLDTRFIVDERELRSKYLVRAKPEELEFVQIDYSHPSQKAFSFRLERAADGRYSAKPLSNAPKTFAPESVNQSNADAFMQDFAKLGAEVVVTEKNTRDSVIATEIFAIITFKTRQANAPKSYKIFSLYNPTADRGDGDPGFRQKIQRYFIDGGEDEFFLGQHLVFRQIFWGYPYFFQQDKVVLEEDEALFLPKPGAVKPTGIGGR